MAVLVSADVAVFLVLREAIRAVRDGAAWGPDFAEWLSAAVPRGALGGWEFCVALIIGLAVAGSYGRGDARRDLGSVLNGVALAAGLSLWNVLVVAGPAIFVMSFACTAAVVWLGVGGERLAIDSVVARFLPNPNRGERVLFVGDPGTAASQRIEDRLVTVEHMKPLGWVVGEPGVWGKTVLGGPNDIWDVFHQSVPDTVVLCGVLPNALFEAAVEAATIAGCRVLAMSRYEGIKNMRPGLVSYGGLPFVELTVPSLKARQLLIKRVVDLIGSGLGLVLLSPVFAVVAIAIKLDSRGPVFFTQDRVGMGGRTFRFVKFRTMREGADDEKSDMAHLNQTGDPRLFKIPNDPRVTRLGARLRRWSMDELPQLWNVFVGDMSLVGPRPFFESDLEAYRDHHFIRLGAKPGMTGLWQVKGRSSVVDFEEVVRMDREYIDQWSLWLDLLILVRTFPAVLSRSGAF